MTEGASDGGNRMMSQTVPLIPRMPWQTRPMQGWLPTNRQPSATGCPWIDAVDNYWGINCWEACPEHQDRQLPVCERSPAYKKWAGDKQFQGVVEP